MKRTSLVKRVLGVGAEMLVVALLCGVTGFVYAYHPQRDQLAVSLERPPAPQDAIVSGTVSHVGSGWMAVDIQGAGTKEFALASNATSEELRPLLPTALTPGLRVNVGAERSDFGIAITGIVLVRSAR